MDVGDSSTSESTESAPSRRGKQKVPRRKLMKKPKRRGEYKPKATLGPVDLEVAECLFSDDDVRADFLDNVSTADMQAESEQNVQTTDASDSGSTSSVFSEMLSDTASDMSIVFSPPASNAGSRRGSLSDSRPSSANESRPSSVSEMGPPSSVESESRRSTDILAPSPTEHDSTQSSSSSKEISSGTCDLMNKLGVLPSVETTDASANSPSTTFIASALQECRSILPAAWVAIADKICLHLLLFSVTTPKAIQREIVLFYDGRVSMFVHDNTIFYFALCSSSVHDNNCLVFSAKAGKRLAIDDDAASTTVKKARTSSADTSPSAPPAGVDLDTCRALVEAWMSINTYKDSKSVRDLKQGVEYSIVRMWKAEHDKFGPKLYVEVHFSEFETVPVMLPDRFVKLDNGAVQKCNTMIAAGFPPAIRYNGLIKDKAHDVELTFPFLI
ncbi:Mitochondrial inner membrane i-AAA protease complex subunit MGR1 [Frankliniella fusca]|uniref:Mitochondrial inner membrane i-AAA protease complex subunit MGR1 n=1 Tax=Frankliniella fusca TaxID=407009 RepID=A0AAE1L8X3_9NEOP|nr:Mitochondrial inner membrane i-AAA protease complex subunit MGR1 [Frankliniella fusca]